MRVVIIEDEQFASMRLKKMIHEYDENIEILAELESVAESVKWFQNNQEPDLIFLDIHLEDDLSFAIFERVKISCPIIFTTAFDEYAIKAFKLKSIDYLLKPIVQDELVSALDKYKEFKGESKDAAVDLQNLYNIIVNKQQTFRERLSISFGAKIKTLKIDEIAYFSSEEGMTYAYLFDKANYPVDISLDKLGEELDPDKFFRINRKLLICINSIKDVHIYPKSRLKLALNPKFEQEVFVSLDKVTAFKKWLNG
ncbi:MAG: response regulator transcription factor [Bacteroidales bacterium]|nr:response regulator transcription factor [Bacteroidales bacterium]